jgi:hypothetical protein
MIRGEGEVLIAGAGLAAGQATARAVRGAGRPDLPSPPERWIA